jgi:hypothetical protein
MNRWSFASRLLLVLALLGLVASPVATASAMPAMAAASVMPMPDGMACCPDDQPVAPECARDCPLAVLCATGVAGIAVPEGPSFPIRVPLEDEFSSGGHTVLASIAGEPLPKPPQA